MRKEFKRNVCFTFFESYLEQGEQIRNIFGDEKCADYFIALIKYALYEEESTDAIISAFISGLKNTIDANQAKREQAYNKEDVVLTSKILEHKTNNPDATQREIADAVGCSVGKVNKVIKNSNNVNSNANINSNSNNNTMNVNANTFSFCEEKDEEKRELDELTDEELSSLLQEYKKKTPYTELYKKYKLTDNLLDKSLIKRIEKIKQIRKTQAEKIKYAKDLDIDLATFSMLEDVFDTFNEGVRASIDLIKEYSKKDEIDINQIVLFFKDNPEYIRKNQSEKDTYYNDVTQIMIRLKYI